MSDEPNASAKRVLIAEDDAPMSRALSLKLKSSGFDADTAHDGEEVMEKTSKQTYDLILLDLIMPRKDGFTVLKELKERGAHPKVIVLTNLGQEEDRARVMELGAEGYYVKADTPLAQIVELVKQA